MFSVADVVSAGKARMGLCALVSAMCVVLPAVSAAQDVLMHHYDAYRTGVQSHETRLTPANLGTQNFGKLFTLRADGQVIAEPLWVGGYTMSDGVAHNILLVATAHDSVYAFDADGKGPVTGYYWHASLLGKGETSVPSGDTNTTDIVPEVGITGTPVIDRTAGVIYVVSKSRLITNGNASYFQRIHALSLKTGAETMHGPTVIAASVPGTGDDSDGTNVAFDARTENQRPGLALANGSVWIAWASHGDNTPYHGWVLGYKGSDLTKQTGVFNTTPNGSEGGIWMSGGGISVDASGNLYAASGNGDFNGNQSGGKNFSSTVFKFTPGANGVTMATSFTPYNESNLSGQDLDMGTSACTLIDNPSGPVPHLLVTTDKDGTIYLLDRDKMGGFLQNSNEDVQDFSNGGFNVHESLAFFNNQLYLAGDGGPLTMWKFNPSTGLFNTNGATASDSSFGCDGCDGAGSTPSVSANGTANGIVWVLDNSGFNSNPAILHAFDPTLATELYNSTWAANNRDAAGSAVKFTTPTIANGFVYVGGGGVVTVYGLLRYAPPATAAPKLSPAPGAATAPVTVTITDATPGATIHYTVDGTTPTINSLPYSKPVAVTSTTLLQAVAFAPGYVSGATGGGTYLFGTQGNVFTFNSGFSPSSLALNGSATAVAKYIQLTDGNNFEAGSAFLKTPVKTTNFTTSFDFLMSNAQADGFTFVLQNQGLTALGTEGGGLGYGADAPGDTPGISPSAAVKFDLFDNEGEGSDSTGFYTGGVSPTVPAVDLSTKGIDLHSGHIFSVLLSYNGQNLKTVITDAVTHQFFQKTYPAALTQALGAGTALAGFTGGTGGQGVTTQILNWSYSVPVVEKFAATALSATVNGPALSTYTNQAFPSGTGLYFPATAKGQSVSFTVNVAAEATFALNLLADHKANRGIVQLAVDGKNFGNPIDGYTASQTTLNAALGNLLLTAGTHTFTFTVTGKDAASSGYGMTFGLLTLTP